MKYRYSIAIGASLLMFVVYFVTNKNVPATAQTAASDSPSFVVPESFSSSEQLGKLAFSAKCQSCHGENALGNAELAPPLIHTHTTSDLNTILVPPLENSTLQGFFALLIVVSFLHVCALASYRAPMPFVAD